MLQRVEILLLRFGIFEIQEVCKGSIAYAVRGVGHLQRQQDICSQQSREVSVGFPGGQFP